MGNTGSVISACLNSDVWAESGECKGVLNYPAALTVTV